MTDSSTRLPPSHPLKVVPARYPLRLLGAVFALFILLAIVQSIATNPRWDWGIFRQYFFDPLILQGLGRTLLLTLLGTVFGVLFGTLLALARLSKSYLLNSLAWGYIWLFRSLPLLLVLIVLYQTFLSVRQPFARHSVYQYRVLQTPHG